MSVSTSPCSRKSRNAAVIQPQVEGNITRIFVASGAHVTAGEPLMEIETDKVTVEIEAPADGVLGPKTLATLETALRR